MTPGPREHAPVDVHLRRPSDDDLARLLARCKDDVLTYAPAGLTRREWSTTFASGHDYALAVDALSHWKVQENAGLVVRSDAGIEVGANVAMSARLPIGFIDVTCRVVAIVDEPDRFGFAYGTLSVHPERGEEAFIVTRSADGFRFDITAVSRPASRLVSVASGRGVNGSATRLR